ncbi:MAG TPA: hypothetical protein VGZ02_13635, partial [Candidatus Baltobacteraceae bacterium]|nr:hypothetical protein [Candidatus Baltobacteraceae bacterium]
MLHAGKRLFAIAFSTAVLAACGGGSGGMVPGASVNGVPSRVVPTATPPNPNSPGTTPTPGATATPNSPGVTPTPYRTPEPTPRWSPTPRPSSTPRITPTPQPTGTPHSTPTPQPTSTPSSGNVARYDGCPVFTAGDYYNADVTNAAVDPNSANYINSAIQAGDTDSFYASTGYEKVNNANSGTSLLTVKQKVSYHQFPVPYPWQSGYYIERLSDAHGMVVQTQDCHLYESYSTSYSGGVLAAYSGANWDLT